MPNGRRRKIEIPTDTQPQFELGDTAEDIERRRERDETEERERQRERLERERTERTKQLEESEEMTEKQPRTDTDTDVESIQSRQNKGQMKSIEFMKQHVEFVKQHEELYDKTHTKFKDEQRKEGLWERLAASRNLSVNTVKKWFKTQRTRYGKLTHAKSGQAAVKSTERQT